MRADGTIEEIGIAPGLYNDKMLDLFMPFATSERYIAWGMEREPAQLREVGETLAFLRQPEPCRSPWRAISCAAL